MKSHHLFKIFIFVFIAIFLVAESDARISSRMKRSKNRIPSYAVSSGALTISPLDTSMTMARFRYEISWSGASTLTPVSYNYPEFIFAVPEFFYGYYVGYTSCSSLSPATPTCEVQVMLNEDPNIVPPTGCLDVSFTFTVTAGSQNQSHTTYWNTCGGGGGT
jgi:hypothetical protein